MSKECCEGVCFTTIEHTTQLKKQPHGQSIKIELPHSFIAIRMASNCIDNYVYEGAFKQMAFVLVNKTYFILQQQCN